MNPEIEDEAEFIVAVNKHGRKDSVPMRFDWMSLGRLTKKSKPIHRST